MRVKGTEEWQGTRSNPVTMRQQVYFEILKEMTGNQFYPRDSREAYYIIKKYKADLEDCVHIDYCLDSDNPYVLYGDVFIYGEYKFTFENRCVEVIQDGDTIDDVTIVSYETYYDDCF